MKNINFKLTKLEITFAIGIAILIFVTLISVNNLKNLEQEPEFKITTEECYNLPYRWPSECSEIECPNDFMTYCLECNKTIKGYEEVCEFVEVDAIIGGSSWKEIIYPKESLTIEWLDKNCRCLEVEGCKFIEDCPKGYPLDICLEYKCGDYLVKII